MVVDILVNCWPPEPFDERAACSEDPSVPESIVSRHKDPKSLSLFLDDAARLPIPVSSVHRPFLKEEPRGLFDEPSYGLLLVFF